eukprot:GHVU01065940.1.p1 GENE.GHVU01065940.1~~GHVU01065940.1.p1  ORF type:complete len:381 (+),score=50.73 GHVU01065940.1:155-1297(+)
MSPFVIKCAANEAARKDNYTGPLALTPQVRNYLKALGKRLRDQHPIKTNVDLQKWGESNQMTELGAAWTALSEHQMFVLPNGVFEDPNEPCIVFSTKALLRNGVAAARSGRGFGVQVDGTYKTHRGGFPLLVIGTTKIVMRGQEYVHAFLPIAIAFAKSESISTYRVLMGATAAALLTFFDTELAPAACGFDRCDAANTAAATEFPGIRPLNDWAHAIRNGRKHRVEDQMKTLRRCSDPVQFKALQALVVAKMRAAGCFSREQIVCLAETYAGDRWGNWHVGASLVAGIPGHTNSLERFNRSFKDDYLCGDLRLSTELLLLDKLPRAVRRTSMHKGGNDSVMPSSLNPTSAMIMRAHQVMQNKKWYIHTGKTAMGKCVRD